MIVCLHPRGHRQKRAGGPNATDYDWLRLLFQAFFFLLLFSAIFYSTLFCLLSVRAEERDLALGGKDSREVCLALGALDPFFKSPSSPSLLRSLKGRLRK